MTELLQTPLHATHLAAGARMVPFAGWDMPLRYGSAVAEHHAVRGAAGIFDVSHMGRFRITGPGAADWVSRSVTGNAAGLANGRGMYGLLCRDDGTTIDDLIVYRLSPNAFFLVVNASNRQKDWDALLQTRGDAVAELDDDSDRLAMIALQGPAALGLLAGLAESGLGLQRRFDIGEAAIAGIPCLVARTGYTGEDGAEVMPPAGRAADLWDALVIAGAVPCGLAARDSLRLEAGLHLYGNDLDDTTDPIAAGLGWTIDWDHDFRGRAALAAIREHGPNRTFVALRADARSIPRAGAPVLHQGVYSGNVTSGGFSPTLGVGIALAYVHSDHARRGTALQVVIRDRTAAATVVKRPFTATV